MKPIKPKQGQLTGTVTTVSTNLIEELVGQAGDNFPTFDEQINMLRFNPILGSCAEITTLIGVLRLGKYVHPNDTIQAWVNENFHKMEGNFSRAIGELFGAKFFSYSASEWSVTNKKVPGEWRLNRISIRDPRQYNFRVKDRELYDIQDESGEETIDIPISNILLITNGDYLSFGDPTQGTGDCIKSWAVNRAYRIVLSETLIAAQRQAVPITVGQSDPEEVVFLTNADGSPLRDPETNEIQTIPAPLHLHEQLLNLDNRSVISTTLNSKIQTLNHQTDGQFLLALTKHLEKLSLIGFHFPETILFTGDGGLGNSGLNEGHMKILLMAIDGILEKIRSELLEKCIFNLVFWNFGEQETYGHFETPKDKEEHSLELLKILIDGVQKGAFSIEDEAYMNRVKNLAGVGGGSITNLSFSKGNYWELT